MSKKYNRIAQDLRTIRKEAGLTQKQLAEKSGVSQSAIIKYENGQRKPQPEYLNKILLALGFEMPEGYADQDIDDRIFDITDDDLIFMYEEVDTIMRKLRPEYMQRLYEYALDMYRFNGLDD